MYHYSLLKQLSPAQAKICACAVPYYIGGDFDIDEKTFGEIKSDMIEAEVWRLPNPFVNVQVPIKLTSEGKVLFGVICIFASSLDKVDDFWFKENGSSKWAPLGKISVEIGKDEELFSRILRLVEVFVIMLSTRGVEVTTRVGNKVISLERNGKPLPVPKIAYTYISCPGVQNDSSGNSSGRTIRLHLRRGHVRRQRFGPGLEQVKVVYIEPTFVGTGEGFERLGYKVK